MKKLHLFFVLMIVVAINLQAQNNIRPSFHFGDMNLYNPANLPLKTWQTNYFSLQTNYKFVKNEDEIWNKPPSFLLNYIGETKHSGLYYSVGYFNDSYSFFNRNNISGGVVYRMRLGEMSSLSFGARISVNFDVVNWNKLMLPLARNGAGLMLSPDLDLGVEYSWKKLRIGLASKNIIGFRTKIDDEVLIQNERLTSLSASYLFNVGSNFEIAPLAMVYFDNRMIYDVGVYFRAYEYVSVSYVLRANELRSIISADVRLIRNLYLGVAIDFSPMLPDKNFCVALRYGF